MDLVYIGRHGAVVVPCPDGREETVKWGDTFATSDEHAESLLEQTENWQPAKAGGNAKKAQPKASSAGDKAAEAARKE